MCGEGPEKLVWDNNWIYTNCLNETKKGGKTSKSNLKRRNIGIANMRKKYRRQDRDPGWLDHILAR